VVDAGGQGLLYILEGILRHIRGEEVREAASVTAIIEHVHVPEGGYNFDTQFIIQGSALDVDAIRDHIATLGDSVLVVGDASTVKVHVHCDSPGQALDYGISLGQVSAIIIDNMQQQYQEFRAAAAPVPTLPPSAPPASLTANAPLGEIGVIAVAAGEGLARVFESLGISAVVPGGQTMNPSTQDLLNAITQVPNEQVILLPNNSNIILTASQAKDLTSKEVAVVPTRTIPQGIAALLALNYQADLPANAAFMEEASRQVRTVEITRAVRSVQLNGLAIAEGQIIGLLNDQLTAAGAEMLPVVDDLLTRAAAAESEIITIYYGANVPLEEADALATHVRALYPALTVEVFDGGQPHYYYIISIE
jgi:uncharacterized protein